MVLEEAIIPSWRDSLPSNEEAGGLYQNDFAYAREGGGFRESLHRNSKFVIEWRDSRGEMRRDCGILGFWVVLGFTEIGDIEMFALRSQYLACIFVFCVV